MRNGGELHGDFYQEGISGKPREKLENSPVSEVGSAESERLRRLLLNRKGGSQVLIRCTEKNDPQTPGVRSLLI